MTGSMTTSERAALQRALEGHPEVKRRFPQFWRVRKMDAENLRKLARDLGINVAAIQHRAPRARPPANAASLRSDSPQPPFKGTFGFTLNIEAFGINTPRRARVVWEYTPEWPYYPPKGRMRIDGQEDCAFTVEVETVTQEDGEGGPLTLYDWQPLVLWGVGLVGEDVVDRIFERIDADARSQNKTRRRARRAGAKS